MTVRSAWLLNPGQTRQDTRLTPTGAMLPVDAMTSRSGIIPGGTPMLLTGSGMTGSVSTGRAVVQGTSAQGAYPAALTAAEPITVANGHASLARIDSVFLVIYDQLFDTSGTTLAAVTYVQGTAAASPSAPAAPATTNAALRLWDITVPAGASSGSPINWATALTDRRVYTVAVGGIGVGTDVVGAYIGQWRDQGGTSGLFERWTGSAWEQTLRLGNAGRIELGDAAFYRSAADTIKTDDSLIVGGVGQVQFARKSAATTLNTVVAMTNDPHLFLPIVANGVYLLEGLLSFTSSIAADIRIGWTLPAGATGMAWQCPGPTTALGTGGTTDTVKHSMLAIADQPSFGGADPATVIGLHPYGIVRNGATAGSVTLQWAQAAASASDTVMRVDSYITLRRVL